MAIAATPAGYEEAVVTKTARVWSWILLAVLVVGIAVAVVTTSYAVQTFAMVLAQVLAIVGYLVISRARRSAIVWVNIGLMLALGIVNLGYGVLNAPLKGIHSMESYWDPGVPTIPAFVIPYLGLYVVLFFTQGFFGYRLINRQLRTYLLALLLSMGTSLVTFMLFQSYIPTDQLDAGSYDGPFGAILKYVNEDLYGNQFYSAFPSMHCGFATVFAITWYRRRKPLWSAGMIILSVMIVIGTQVLHEHYLMDAMYGIIVAVAAYAVSWFWLEYRPMLAR